MQALNHQVSVSNLRCSGRRPRRVLPLWLLDLRVNVDGSFLRIVGSKIQGMLVLRSLNHVHSLHVPVWTETGNSTGATVAVVALTKWITNGLKALRAIRTERRPYRRCNSCISAQIAVDLGRRVLRTLRQSLISGEARGVQDQAPAMKKYPW